MIEIKGTYNTAKVFTDTCDSATIAQVTNLMNQPSVAGAKVRIMPDCHAGAGCVIGTTMTITDKVIPNLVGVDIGCGMLATKLKEQRIDLPKFDSVSQAEVPAGMRMRKTPHTMSAEMSADELTCYGKSGCKVNDDVFRLSLGTLGGGNHFWELDKDEEGSIWLVVHTGSRRSGKDVAEYYQKQAYEARNIAGSKYRELLQQKRAAYIEQVKAEGRQKELGKLLKKWNASQPKAQITVPHEVAWCEGQAHIFKQLHAPDTEEQQKQCAQPPQGDHGLGLFQVGQQLFRPPVALLGSGAQFAVVRVGQRRLAQRQQRAEQHQTNFNQPSANRVFQIRSLQFCAWVGKGAPFLRRL